MSYNIWNNLFDLLIDPRVNFSKQYTNKSLLKKDVESLCYIPSSSSPSTDKVLNGIAPYYFLDKKHPMNIFGIKEEDSIDKRLNHPDKSEYLIQFNYNKAPGSEIQLGYLAFDMQFCLYICTRDRKKMVVGKNTKKTVVGKKLQKLLESNKDQYIQLLKKSNYEKINGKQPNQSYINSPTYQNGILFYYNPKYSGTIFIVYSETNDTTKVNPKLLCVSTKSIKQYEQYDLISTCQSEPENLYKNSNIGRVKLYSNRLITWGVQEATYEDNNEFWKINNKHYEGKKFDDKKECLKWMDQKQQQEQTRKCVDIDPMYNAMEYDADDDPKGLFFSAQIKKDCSKKNTLNEKRVCVSRNGHIVEVKSDKCVDNKPCVLLAGGASWRAGTRLTLEQCVEKYC
jgi:hypothetical protein